MEPRKLKLCRPLWNGHTVQFRNCSLVFRRPSLVSKNFSEIGGLTRVGKAAAFFLVSEMIPRSQNRAI